MRLTHLILTLIWANTVFGLILLKPDSGLDDPLQYENLDIFDKLLDIRKADLSSYQTGPFEPAVDIDDVVTGSDASDDDGELSTQYGLEEDDESLEDDMPQYTYDEEGDSFHSPDELYRRKKRSAVGHVDAKVEVLVVVDNAIYRRYLDRTKNQNQREALAMLRQYYGMVFAMVDQRFKTIDDPELQITVKISGILVSESRQESAWVEYLVAWSRRGDGEGRVNANKALKKFIKWLLSQKNMPRYDHAMAFTGYQLVNRLSIDLGGMAYVSSICNTKGDGNSASIVADPGNFQVVKVATHELGHSLGASHDGDKNNKDCPPDHNYVMSPQNTNDHNKFKNAFYFSHCSVRQMKKLLRTEEASCVRDAPVVYYQYNLERQPPGQRYLADQQCQLVFGKASEFCDSDKMKSVMCGQLWCKDPENGVTCRTHSFLTALPGTTCGSGKVCHLGVCQRNPFDARATGRSQIQSTQGRPQRQRSQSNRQKNKPTFRIRMNSSRRAGRRRSQSRRQVNRNNRRRNRGRGRKSKQCSADQNVKYCQGLMDINPRACRRKAVRKYCCKTCPARRRRKRI